MKFNTSLKERILHYTEKDAITECLNWTGAKARDGYGVININGVQHTVTRVWWELNKGPWKSYSFVLHKCDNPACINIDHLYLGSAADNARDMVTRGRMKGGTPPIESSIIEQAKQMLLQNLKGNFIAKKLGISQTKVSHLKKELSNGQGE